MALTNAPLSAQGALSVRGSIVDSLGVPVAGARVELLGSGQRSTSRDDGAFIIDRIAPGVVALRVTRIGYRPLVLTALEVPRSEPLVLVLSHAPVPLSAVVVAPGVFGLMAQTTSSTQALGREQLMTRPQLGEDLFRSINRLPGVSAGDFSAGFHVRGAEVDQLLVMFDGVELYEPFHMKDFDNALSILDVQSIGGVELTTGGFTAERGGRLGAALSLASTEPRTDRARTAFGVSVTNLRAQSQGGFDDGKGSWLVSARRGYMDLALRLAGRADSISPNYDDLFAKVQYDLSSQHRLSAHLLLAGDQLQYAVKDGEIGSRYGSSYGWVTWEARLTEALRATTVISSGKLNWNRRGNEKGVPVTRSTVFDVREFTFTGVRSDWTFDASEGLAWRWGMELKPQKASYDYSATRSIRTVQADTILDLLIPYRTAMRPNGTQWSAYLAPRFRPFSWLVAEAGVRWDRASWSGDDIVAPRVNALIAFSPTLSMRVATGRYVQPQQLFGLQVQDGVSSFGSADIADHRVIGLEYRPWSNTTLRVEGYERITTQERPRWVNLRGDVIVFPELNLDRLLRDARSGAARGVEVSGQVTTPGGWDVSASYAQSSVTDLVGTVSIPRAFDQQHTAYVDASWKPPGSGWRFSAAWQLHSGWPESPARAIVDTVKVGKTARQTIVLTEYGPISQVGRNRLPWYHRVDLRATRDVETSGGKFSFFFDLFNVFDTENPAAYNYRASVRNNVLTFTHSVVPQLGRLPSAGVSWEF